jgi:hypothetical protein
LIDDAYHSDPDAYVAALETLRRLPISWLTFSELRPTSYRQLTDDYIAGVSPRRISPRKIAL